MQMYEIKILKYTTLDRGNKGKKGTKIYNGSQAPPDKPAQCQQFD